MAANSDTEEESILAMRREMRRALTLEDRATYRGISRSAKTGKKYEKLIGIQSAEELISAERYGAFRIPSDDSENIYFFSRARGLTATLNPDYVQAMTETHGFGVACNQTLAELDEDYRNAPLPGTAAERDEDLEQLLDNVAKRYLDWARDYFGHDAVTPRRQV